MRVTWLVVIIVPLALSCSSGNAAQEVSQVSTPTTPPSSTVSPTSTATASPDAAGSPSSARDTAPQTAASVTGGPPPSAASSPGGGPSQLDDLRASMAELETFLRDAGPDERALLEQQLASMRQAMAMLESVQAAGARPPNLPLAPELRGFFTPEAPAAVPAWLPDGLTRAEVTDEMMRCPEGARVYAQEDAVGCAIPREGGVPLRDGLQLGFSRATGRLASQRFYERRLLRWAVEYHATGGRASVGFYVATEPLEYPEDGLHTSFAPNGTIVSQTSFRAGVRHGWSKLWEDDGTPIGATRYESGTIAEELFPDGTRRTGT